MKKNYDINDFIFKNLDNPSDWIEFQNTDFNHLPNISFIENVKETTPHLTNPQDVFEAIRKGDFKEEISLIRKTADNKERQKLKQKLPAILFGGTFKNRKDLEEPSDLICIDYDHVKNMHRFIFRLQFYSFIYGYFISPSGDGLKVLVRTNIDNNENYKSKLKQIISSFEQIGLKADSSKVNINDACYLSYDPNAYFNPKATIWRNTQYQVPEETNWSESQIKDSVEFIIDQIEEQKVDITSNYNDWINIAFALNNQFKEDGREYFQRVSQFYKDYQDTICDKQYDYCSGPKDDGITIRTFFKIAKEQNLKLTNVEIVTPINSDPFDQEFYTGEELLLRKVSQLPTLLDPILPQVGLVALGGSSDVGKSTFLRHLAINISSGEEKFLDFYIKAKHNSVIYVSTEDDDNAVSFLIHKHNETLQKPSSGFKRLIYVFDTYNLLKKLDRMIKKNPTDLIIIDTFSDLYSGEMNQTNRIRSYLHDFALFARKHKCLILMLHHTGKRTEDLAPSKNNLLGSQGFEAKMRLVLELRKDQDNPDIRHLCIVKSNYLSKEYKDASYVLRFDSDMLFANTGERVPFSELATRKFDKAAEKEEWKKIAKPLIDTGKTYQEVSVYLKEKGYSVSKSTIQREIPKNN